MTIAFPQDISLDEAITLLRDQLSVQSASEIIGLDKAMGRITSDDIIADINVPQNDTAAVDGYAAFFEDLKGTPLKVIGNIKAGHPFDGMVQKGVAYRIFTGAPMPKSADGLGPDTIAMQEHCQIDTEGKITFPQNVKQGMNYRPKGENISKGSIAIAKGTRLHAAEIGLLAAIGQAEVSVMRPLKIALISMGDELAETGSDAGFQPGMIHDSNRPMLKQMLLSDGHEVIDFGIIPDDLAAVTEAFNAAAKQADVILSSAGSSEGDEDHARQAILDNDGAIHFWRLSLKPGRPMMAGHIGNVPVYAVPGNPVAVFVCYRLLVAPLLAMQQGCDFNAPLKIPAPVCFSQKHRQGRTEYLRARLTKDGIIINGRAGAGVITSLTGAHGLVEIPSDHDDIKEGDILSFIPFQEAGL